MSGWVLLARVDRLRAVAGFGDNPESWIGLQDHPEARAYERLVVGDQHADGHATPARSSGRRARSAKPAGYRRGSEFAPVEIDAMTEWREGVVEVVDRAVASDLESELARVDT